MSERELTAADWRGWAQQDFPADSWSADGPVLHAVAAGPPVDLITRERFGDFVLSFEWRLPRAGCSGVAYRVNEALGPAAQSAPAMQLRDDEHHPQGADALSSCGALSGLMAPWHDQRDIANVYYSARIVVRGSLVEHWIDDQQVVGCDLGSEDLRERIARSRFRDYHEFGRERAGHIVLQHGGTEAWLRGLRLEIL